MLAAATTPTWQGYHRTMSSNAFRLAIVVAVVVVSLLGVIAFATVLASELTDRSVLVLGVILGFLGPTIVSLLNLLRTDAAVEKVDRVHEAIINGELRENVVKAIKQSEADPQIRETRVENAAQGVQRDRHDLKNRKAAERLRGEMAERIRRRNEEPSD